MNTAIAGKQSRIDSLVTNLQSVKAEKERLVSEVSDLRARLSRSEARNAEMTKENNEYATGVRRLTVQCDCVSASLKKESTAKQEAEREVFELTNHKSSLQAHLTQLNTDVTSLREALRETHFDKRRLNDELSEMRHMSHLSQSE
eukprot:GHVN01061775.1.p1 GENE.GHVN01061775.1~~GHVN01061775.1.p1  ORF type:complete len:154 (+),score=46.93 GHVN01061775.1:28-462(+)